MTKPSTAEWRTVLVLSLVLVALTTAPYVAAYRVNDAVFGGFLLNPADGNSYFAKMREGWRGEWLFTLPYTAEPGPGAFIFTYYLFLGHVARWTGASVDVVYHTARALSGLAALLAGYAVAARFFETRRARLVVWGMWAVGSGLGWAAVAFGLRTADLWVAEAIPFLSVYANAHFGLTTALLLLLVAWTAPGLAPDRAGWPHLLLVAVTTTLLAIVQPMALLNVGLTLAGVFVWRGWTMRPASLAGWVQEWAPALVFGAAALPWLVHAYWLTATHPVLAQWNAQNVTPSPPLWDAAITGGVLLLLAIPGAYVVARRQHPREMVALAWLVVGVLALYAPFALQRRLSIGLWLPLTVLAGIGLREVVWPRLRPRLRPVVVAVAGAALVLSNVLVFAATVGAVAGRDTALFITPAEAAALDWLEANAGRGLVAAPPRLGLLIPARSDARVLYGHPFETVQSQAREAELVALFANTVSGPMWAQPRGVDYVLATVGRPPGWTVPSDWRWPVVFEQDGVFIYAP